MFDDFGTISHFGPIFIAAIFIIVMIGILVPIIGSIAQWSKNEKAPRLSVLAKVKTMRTEIRRNGDHFDMHTHTDHYVTFEVESGDRIEFSLTGREYGMLAEGDYKTLSFQGTRFYGFDRIRNPLPKEKICNYEKSYSH
ncbi:DUF2500 domain-containing protein [Heyndrickxia acidicola]|uniref:DUF2500 domain-containing protein n=1 Tax=Heyndrickxia acidicola TaxID=209389 RepID=A0ABU6MA30_9BACI|nr:DUF2500 domain-containing protein [Heyndrickxia acidicola]MED1201533.1 DUF2500 domain-containing protein [Heyndrickxia acidicola]